MLMQLFQKCAKKVRPEGRREKRLRIREAAQTGRPLHLNLLIIVPCAGILTHYIVK